MTLAPAPRPQAPRSPVNILLVDDTPAKLLTYEVMLAELGENLIKTSSAEEAFAVLLKTDVALVLTDVSMPEVDGLEFAKTLRAHPRFEFTPIVFVSAVAQSDLDRLRGYTSGAVDYVTAPVMPEVLRAKVKVFVDLYRKQRELESLKGELEARVDERTAELAAFTARLAKSEERLRLAQEAGEVGIWDWNLITGEVYWSRKLKSLFGLKHDVSPTPALFLEMVHPNDRASVRTAVRVAIVGQQPFRHEFRLQRPDGREVWIGSRGEVKAAYDGKSARLIGIVVDITERKRSEESLALSEQRYRTLVETANDIVATMDLEAHFTSVNPAVARILGYTPQELIGTKLDKRIPADEMEKQDAMLQRKLEGETSTQYETQVLAKDGRRITLEVNSKLILDGAGKPIGIHSISRDVTERKEAEARQSVLIHELKHRTKNLLAVIQSIVTNTLSNSRDLTSAKVVLVGRLHALARAQDFITAGNTAGVSLRTLVEAELSAFATQLSIDGAPVVVGGAFAQQFALVIHELATNAAKYGSLSTPDGRVRIGWDISHQGDEPVLTFSWIERDGPPVSEPAEYGFGSRLIALAANGMPRISYEKSGLEFAVDVPLSQVTRASKFD